MPNAVLAEHFIGWHKDDGGPRVRFVNDLNELGVTPVAELPGLAVRYDRPPDYVRRTQDDEIRTQLRTWNFVVIEGPAKSGKSRSAAEAMRAEFADHLLLAPKGDRKASIRALDDVLSRFELELPDCVLWLDELNRYLGEDGLTSDRLRHITGSAAGKVTIIATMRLESLDEFPSETDAGKLGSVVLSKARRVRLRKQLGEDEREYAERRVSPADLRIAAALASQTGLAEYLAAVPELRDRLVANTEKEPVGVAIVRAAIDCRRAGIQRPVPEAFLRQLYPIYCTAQDRRQSNFDDGLVWAMKSVCATARLLTEEEHGSYQPFDQLVEDAENDSSPVPEATWRALLELLADPGEVAELGGRASMLGYRQIAEVALTRAANAGNAGGMNGLGVELYKRGQDAEAKEWFRKAADTGDTIAMCNLGLVSTGAGQPSEAEEWYHKAIDAGDTTAMGLLGVLLGNQGREAEAVTWYRKAADAGNGEAMRDLGVLLQRQGNVAEAEAWYRKAANAGNSDAMRDLAILLGDQSNDTEAETWYRKAAAAGNATVMDELGLVLVQQDRNEEAEGWFRKAADAGNAAAMRNLGALFQDKGNFEEAQLWYGKAIKAGDTHATNMLDGLHSNKERFDNAKSWYRAAADAGNNAARDWLRVMPSHGTTDRWSLAADAVYAESLNNVGDLMAARGTPELAIAPYREAAGAGHVGAMRALAALLADQGKADEAATWQHRAADHG
jgi:hypothetical protein